MSASVLQLIGVRKRFGDTEVLRGIDLEVDRHEVVALIAYLKQPGGGAEK